MRRNILKHADAGSCNIEKYFTRNLSEYSTSTNHCVFLESEGKSRIPGTGRVKLRYTEQGAISEVVIAGGSKKFRGHLFSLLTKEGFEHSHPYRHNQAA